MSPKREPIYRICKRVLPEYKAKDGKTFCNWFVARVTKEAVGCDDLVGMMANQIVTEMSTNVRRWLPLDPDQAQERANAGSLVIAGWRNTEGPHGHVCVVIPGTLTWSKQFGDDVPLVANAGTKTWYGRPASYAFGKEQVPSYWMYIQEDRHEPTRSG